MGDRQILIVTVGLLLIFFMGDRRLIYGGPETVDFDRGSAADLYYGGPATDFRGVRRLLILPVGLLLTYFMGDRRLILWEAGDC